MNTLPIIAAGALALSALAAPAFAQNATGVSGSGAWYMPTGFYGNLAYSNLNSADSPHTDVNAVTGRFGARFGPYVGVEGEASTGFGSDTKTVGGDLTRTHLDNQYAGYLVGFLPITPKFDLLARVGYGGQQYNLKDDTLGTSHDHQFDSVNYGAGAQYSFNGKDGVRVDYTRYDAQGNNPDSNVVSVAYVRKF
jgi:outer membrane immunogenic protein